MHTRSDFLPKSSLEPIEYGVVSLPYDLVCTNGSDLFVLLNERSRFLAECNMAASDIALIRVIVT